MHLNETIVTSSDSANDYLSQRVGAAVRRLRRAQGLKVRRLAELAGITQSTLSKLETGKMRQLPFSTLGRIATALHVDASALLSPLEDAGARIDDVLTPEERALVAAQRQLSIPNRKLLGAVAADWVAHVSGVFTSVVRPAGQ